MASTFVKRHVVRRKKQGSERPRKLDIKWKGRREYGDKW